MPLRPEQLDSQLRQGLAPVYLIAGDEPLFVEEALDGVRVAVRAAGYTEREVMNVESGFDWGRLQAAGSSMSLFGDRRLIELRLPTGKPGTAGAKELAAYCAQPAEDVVLLVSCGALETKTRKAAWVSAFERAGVFCYCWPLANARLPDWLRGRLRRHGLSASGDALELLVERAEGNLLAAAQEIEKLKLLHGGGELSVEQVRAAVADSARFDVFGLGDAALAGAMARCVRILQGLRAEGTDPTLVLWALARDLRLLAEIAGGHAEQAFRKQRVLQGRKPKLQQVAARRPPAAWQNLLARAARADRVIKGIAPGRPWDELIQLATAYAAAARGR